MLLLEKLMPLPGSTDVAFTGERQDTVSGLYDFSAREYSSQGRWPSSDPLGLASLKPKDPQTRLLPYKVPMISREETFMRIMLSLSSIFVILCSVARMTGQSPALRPDGKGYRGAAAGVPVRFDDNYAVPFVTAALNFMHRTNVNSVEMKEFWPLAQLGDAASIATLKIYDKDDLIKPENASAYLIVARNAFSDKNHVLNNSDLDPKVTLFILSYLEEKETAEPLIEKTITYLKRCVTDFSCSSQAEYNFLHEQSPK
jgi:hypothetical protein